MATFDRPAKEIADELFITADTLRSQRYKLRIKHNIPAKNWRNNKKHGN